jgi:YfiH family protein
MMFPTDLEPLISDWPAPARVKAISTTRIGGFSSGVYAGLNLGDHVGDDPDTVARNRHLLVEQAGLPETPLWLDQVHRTRVVDADQPLLDKRADGSVSSIPGRVCGVMTADCLPVLLCNRQGDRVAALHAGWRGLVADMLETGVKAMGCPATELMAWIGPAIGPTAFEVGDEVRQAFITAHPAASIAFQARNGRWLADLALLARQRLETAGVRKIYGGCWCTYNDPRRFYSYRRDGVTGRQASLIWIEADSQAS